MRVTVVNSFYSTTSPSGETAAVLQHVAALRRAGHDVSLLRADTDALQQQVGYAGRTALRVATGMGRRPDVESTRPDLVHVHNLFPNFATRWLGDVGVPVVATLHNYRALCASANLFRDGRICTDCLDRRAPWPSVLHGCYRSRAATLPLAARPWFDRDPVLRHADRLVVLSDRMRQLYRGAGIPDERLQLLPNFLPEDQDHGAGAGGERWVYVGRITPEKGLADALKQWPPHIGLDVIGSGPDEGAARAVAPDDVRFLGAMTREQALARIGRARGLLFPSRWFEGAPMVYPEAMAAGTPVLAFEPSSVASAVRKDGTGMVVGGALGAAVVAAHEEFPALRRHCRSVFESVYSESSWVPALEALYRDVVRRCS